MTEPLIINNFDQAIADSPHKGFGLIKRADIKTYPGAVKAGKELISIAPTSLSKTFTAATTDICTISSGVPITGTAVYLTTTGMLPAGLSTGTVYFIIKLSDTTFKLATTITLAEAGTAVDITDTGTGTHTVKHVAMGTVNHYVRDPRTDEEFWLDSNGRVWFGTTTLNLLHNSALDDGSTALANANGRGMTISAFSSTTAMFLFVFRNRLIDAIDVFGSSNKKTPVWTNGWANDMNNGAGSNNSHHAIFAQDNIIYYCDDRYIGSIKENSGSTFALGDSGTYTHNTQSLDLPSYETAEWLEELGQELLIAGGTWNKIYPWDRVSDSFRIPLAVPENNVQRLKNVGGLVYILAGSFGIVYQTQGTYVQLFKEIPRHVTDNADTIQGITWGGIDSVNGALLIGMSVQTSGNSGAYLIYPDGRLVLDQIPTTGSANVTAFGVTNYLYKIGYNGGVDNHSELDRYSSFEGVVQSAFYKVATKTEKATYSVLEVVMAKPASAGSIRIGYRTDTTSSFTTLSTFTADGSATTFKDDGIGLIDIENIQIQIEISDDPEIVEVRLLP